MSCIIFATCEHHPTTSGGAGVLVAGLAAALGPQQASVILAVPGDAAGQKDFSVGQIVDLEEPNGTVSWFIERSRLMAEAVAESVRADHDVKLVEFTDFEALAWWSLVHRSELGLEAIRIGVRIHGPVEAITDAVGVCPPPLDVLGQMERDVFAMADVVLAPSRAVREWAIGRYEVDPSRIVVAPPPVADIKQRKWSPSDIPSFAHFGRLSEVKGVHDLVTAMGGVIERAPEARLSLIGADGWSFEQDRPMSEAVRSLAGQPLVGQVEFVGRLDRDEALDRLMTAWVAVFPSRYESFCLAAHEVRRAGVPIVVPDLPAFEPFNAETGASKYDGSVTDLERVLTSIAVDPEIVAGLADRPAPSVGDPLDVYRSELPAPRHIISQSALATVAARRLEELTAPQVPAQTAVLERALRLAPAWLVTLAAKALPRRLKRRLLDRSSWWREQARRDAASRRKSIADAIEAGAFPEVEAPEVSVVIPCFNQGEWVEEAAISVFEQTESSWEVILVDDGSTDAETIEILDVLAEMPRVRLIRQENQGLPAARNAGMGEALGEFLVPLDADDELHPEFMEALIEALAGQPDAAYAHCWGRLTHDINAHWATRPFNAYQLLLSNSVLGCVLMRSDAWHAVGGYDESLVDGNEDWDLWLRFLEGGWGQVQVRRPLFRYRIHGPSMSAGTLSEFEEARLALRNRHPDLYSKAAELKASHYPWVSVLVGPGGEGHAAVGFEDIEMLGASRDLESVVSAIHAARGKVIVDLDLLLEPTAEDLRAIAAALESRPDVAFVTANGEPVAWRRWVLSDPGAGLSASVDLDLATTPGGQPLIDIGIAPSDSMTLPPDLPEPELELIRQRPEEEGPLPEWVQP